MFLAFALFAFATFNVPLPFNAVAAGLMFFALYFLAPMFMKH